MRTLRLEIEFEGELENPVATVTEIALAIKDREVVTELRSTKVRALAVRGCVPQRHLLAGAPAE